MGFFNFQLSTFNFFSYLCIVKNLVQHIESLIIKHECVIVPGLGGFLTYRDKALVRNNRLYAPTQRIRFNSLLTYHDGLLAEAYMQDRHISYTEALEAIRTDVERITTSLKAGNTFLLGRIGSLTQIDGNIVLRDNDCKFLPENIGLPVVQLKRLATAQPINTITINIPQTSTNVVRYVASIAIIFLITLFIPNPTGNNSQRASLSFDSLRNIKCIEISDENVVNSEECVEISDKNVECNDKSIEYNDKSVEISEMSIDNNSSLLTPHSSLEKYHLIIASLTSREDAEEYIANHTQFDRTRLQIIECKGKYRISAAGFNKYKEALEYADSIRDNIPVAKKAWILCK